jgi:hypothetical protein
MELIEFSDKGDEMYEICDLCGTPTPEDEIYSCPCGATVCPVCWVVDSSVSGGRCVDCADGDK